MELYSTGQRSHYLHGTSPDEQERLSWLNSLLNGRSLGAMRISGGERILDVGSGLGQLSRDMARQAGQGGKVIGVERDRDQLAAAERLVLQEGELGLVEFRQGEAIPLPLHQDEWSTFDIAHARFLLEHVPDPLSVVQELLRAVHPGGRIILEDDAHDTMRLWPEPPGFSRLWRAYMRTYDRVGNDPHIGHRLVALLTDAGAIPQSNTLLFFGACAGQPDLLHASADNIIRIVSGVRDQILQIGEFDSNTFAECINSIRRWSKRRDAAIWYAVSWAEGIRP